MNDIIESIGDLPNWNKYEPQIQRCSNYAGSVSFKVLR